MNLENGITDVEDVPSDLVLMLRGGLHTDAFRWGCPSV